MMSNKCASDYYQATATRPHTFDELVILTEGPLPDDDDREINMKKDRHRKCRPNFRYDVRQYAENSTLHGLRYMVHGSKCRRSGNYHSCSHRYSM